MMNTPKHTPGPWVIRYKDTVYAQSGRFIADCELTPYDARPQPPNSTDAANAHLIAAAPAMYEALQWARQYLRMPNFHPDNSYTSEQWARDYNKLTDVLAQAEGRG